MVSARARERARQPVRRGAWQWTANADRTRAGWAGGGTRGGRTGGKELDETGPEEEASREGVHGAHEDECAARGGVVRCARGKEEREADGLSDRCGEAVGERHEDGLDRARDPHAAHGRRVGELEQRDPCPESEALECLWRRLGCGSSVTERQAAGGRWRAAGGGSRTSHVAQIRCGDGSIRARRDDRDSRTHARD